MLFRYADGKFVLIQVLGDKSLGWIEATDIVDNQIKLAITQSRNHQIIVRNCHDQLRSGSILQQCSKRVRQKLLRNLWTDTGPQMTNPPLRNIRNFANDALHGEPKLSNTLK